MANISVRAFDGGVAKLFPAAPANLGYCVQSQNGLEYATSCRGDDEKDHLRSCCKVFLGEEVSQ